MISIRTAESNILEGLRWHGREDTVEIKPFRLDGPMIYTSPGVRAADPSAIVLAKRLRAPQSSTPVHVFGESIERYLFHRFYSGYAGMSAEERWGYLRWLHEGRPDTKVEGFLLLFLQGLERRVLVDGKDHGVIWEEIWRLQLPGKISHFSFHYAAFEFLLLLISKAPDAIPLEHLQLLSKRLKPASYWDPEAGKKTSLLVWWCTRQYGGLPLWMAYQCARVSLDARQTVVVQRADEEMRQLFALRFQERWDEIVPLTLPPKARCRLIYEPLNPSLTRVSTSWPDPLKLYAAWGKIEDELVSIYNGCQQELRPLALFLGKEGASRSSIGAWDVTPSELRQGEHPATAVLKKLVKSSLREDGFASFSIGDIATQFEISPREIVAATTATKLAAWLQSSGFGIEPDARLTGKMQRWDEEALLFALPSSHGQNAAVDLAVGATDRYLCGAFLLKLAFYVTQAAGPIKPSAVSLITTRLSEILDWNELEKLYFAALADLTSRHGVEKNKLRAPAQVQEYDLEAVGQFLLQLAAHDKRVGNPQEEALRWAWKRLNLEPRKLKAELDALSLKGVIFFKEFSGPARGEKIPSPPVEPGKNVLLQLDRGALAALLSETHHVQTTLNEAMLVEDDVEDDIAEVIEPEPAKTEEEFLGLAPRFVPLLRALLEREEWLEKEAQELARQHSVMLSGAIEAINDWAFESLDAQLLWEDGENLTVERALLK